MRTIKGSSGRGCAFIILFQFYSSKSGVFDGNLSWVCQYDAPTFILGEELIQY